MKDLRTRYLAVLTEAATQISRACGANFGSVQSPGSAPQRLRA
jgi:hypothetical protein